MSTTLNDLASRDNWRADHRVVPKMPALTSSRAEVEGSRRVILKVTSAGSPFPSRFDALQRCDVVPHLCLGRDSARPSSDFVAAVAGRASRLTSNRQGRAAWPRLGQIFPSSDYLDRVDARALCESPSLIRPRPPIQNSPDQPTSLQRPVRDYKNRSRPERHRGWRTRRYSGHSRGIDSTAGHRARHSAILPLVFATRFDIANDKDAADPRS